MTNQILCGDCLEVLKTFPGNCIDLTVTSPPYDNLRSYNGYVFDFEGIARELYRVTKEGGVVVWVVGDATINGSETGTSFKQALYFKDVCGFRLHDTMIYQKSNPVPLTHNRYEQQFEFMFVLSKSRPKTFNGIYDTAKEAGKIKCHPNINSSGVIRTGQDNIVKSQRLRYNIWSYSVGYMCSAQDKNSFQHPAIFPESLAQDHILSWSNEGDLVLDPMCGSGTTCKMALLNNRNYIGIDISEEYCELSRRRIEKAKELKEQKLF